MIQYETELIHHGVKGMKWGVRKYYNKDGSLNSKGTKAVNAYDTSVKKWNSITAPKYNKSGYINKKWDQQTTDYHTHYNKNYKQIKKGMKIRAKQGNRDASIGYYQSKSNKQKATAIGAGVAGGLLLRKAIKNNGLKTLYDFSGDTTMSTLYRNRRNRKLAAGIIAASSAITLAALSKRNQKKADEYRKK